MGRIARPVEGALSIEFTQRVTPSSFLSRTRTAAGTTWNRGGRSRDALLCRRYQHTRSSAFSFPGGAPTWLAFAPYVGGARGERIILMLKPN